MTQTGQSILQMAGTTAAIGMGVVFVALFLLSVYMHYFKVFIAWIERRHHASREAKQITPAPAPELAPAPAPGADEGAQLAAAVAVGLRLEGVGGAPGGSVAAAIAAALALHRSRISAALTPRLASGRWPLAGRLEMMGARVRRQQR